MTIDTLAFYALFGITREEKEKAIPEPEFKPFRFPEPDAAAVRAEALAPAHTAREPRTLEELGVPGALARELEATFRVLGATRGDKVTGFTFRAEDGTKYALRTAAPARDAGDLAA